MLYELIPADKVRLLDLGCAGGGLVKSILDDGGFSVGIEGSDYPREHGLGSWPDLGGENLFTADLTEPLDIWDEYRLQAFLFNVVTAWEFFEHVHATRIPALMVNIMRHLEPGGLLIGSISTAHSLHDGVDLHQTVECRSWWMGMFAGFGMGQRHDLEAHFGDEWVRGPRSAQPVPRSFPFVVILNAGL